MTTAVSDPFEIFLAGPPGLEDVLAAEALALGFAGARAVPGGVKFKGLWQDAWRANLVLRGASRVLARIDSFQAFDLDKLARRARRVPWTSVLRRDVPVHVDVTCRRSRVLHSGAVAERIANAIEDKCGSTIAKDAPVTVMVRHDNDICTISVDTSGELLHKRGNARAVHRAPMRETMAALFLRQCGYDGRETVVDPMCGAGTFVIEAAEISRGLAAGRARAFAFEQLVPFDATQWQAVRAKALVALQERDLTSSLPLHHHGRDRDLAAIATCRLNATAAGVTDVTTFAALTVSDLTPPDGPPGLVIVNPPYGGRLGDPDTLATLYTAFGRTMINRFQGWRVGLITSNKTLAYATGLPWLPPAAPVAHGGLRVTLFRTDALR